MANETRTIDVVVAGAAQATRNIRAIEKAFDTFSTFVGMSDKELSRLEGTFDRVRGKIAPVSQGLAGLKTEFNKTLRENSKLASSLGETQAALTRLQKATGVSDAALAGLTRAERDARAATAALAGLQEGWTRLQKLPDVTAAGNALTSTLTQQGRFKYGGYDVKRATDEELAAIRKVDEESRRTFLGDVNAEVARRQAVKTRQEEAAAARQVTTAVQETAKATEALERGFQINALRYALYDVANTLQRVRDGAFGALNAVVGTGIAFEKNFVNVVRTSQVTGGAVDLLRQQFIDLQSSLPINTEDLTRIGTLAAQMGVAAGDIASFTEITAMFAATSGVSAEESATAFSRLSQMLSDVPEGREGFERLASAILKTGVNAIATEQQILRGTTQIASIGNVAGLSAQDIIALSSAMSSLGMSPELQRSIITSSFTKILSAVRGSTEQAEKFGAVLGMTGEQFQRAWEGDGYNTYRQLLQAIAESPNAIGLLQELGLASQRLTPNLLKLGQASELLSQTNADTYQGWTEMNEVQRQYDLIAQTTAAKVQVLTQTWEAFLVAIGDDAVGAVGFLAGGLTNLLKVLSEIANFGPLQGVVDLLAILTTAIGVIAALGTVLTLTAAAGLGGVYVWETVRDRLVLMGGAGAAASASMTGLATSMRVATGAATTLSAAMRLANAALAAATIAGLGVTYSNDINEFLRDVRGASNDVNTLMDDVVNSQREFVLSAPVPILDLLTGRGMARQDFSTLTQGDAGLLGFMRGLGNLSGPLIGDISLLDSKIADLAATNPQAAAREINKLKDAFFLAGGTTEQFVALMPDSDAAMQLAAESAGVAAEGLVGVSEGFDDAEVEAAAFQTRLQLTADALGLVTDDFVDAEAALSNMRDAITSGAQGFFDIGGWLEAAFGTDQTGGLAEFQTTLGTALTDTRTWADSLTMLYSRGAGSLATAFAAEGPAASAAIKEALTLNDTDLAALEVQMELAAFYMSEAFANSFQTQNATLADVYQQVLKVDPAQAGAAVQELLTQMRSADKLTESEARAFEEKYNITLNVALNPDFDFEQIAQEAAQEAQTVTPIQIPVTYYARGGTQTTQKPGWLVEEGGNSIVLNVDPNTDQGTAILKAWRENEYEVPAELQVFVDTTEATAELIRLRKLSIDAANSFDRAKALREGRGYASGGLVDVPGYASGGLLRGPGTGTSDSMLAAVSNGEFVARAAAVSYYGADLFNDLNRMRLPRFAAGGLVGGDGGTSGVGGATVNIDVTQNYPTTVDPIQKLKEDAENALAGIW